MHAEGPIPMTEPVAPPKRGPGRPRKAPVAKPQVEAAAPTPDAWKTPELAKFPPDERIGMEVANPAWTVISFSDDRQYRIEDGVIVERVR